MFSAGFEPMTLEKCGPRRENKDGVSYTNTYHNVIYKLIIKAWKVMRPRFEPMTFREVSVSQVEKTKMDSYTNRLPYVTYKLIIKSMEGVETRI